VGGRMKRQRDPRLGVALTVSLVCAALFVPTPGSAATQTCGDAYRFAGRGYNPSGYNPRGAEAEVDVRAGDLCENGNGPDAFTTSWVMLAGNNGYAQVGHMFKNFGADNHRFFYEFDIDTTSGGFTRVLWCNPVFGNHHNFRASRNSDGHVHFTVEGNNPPGSAETTFDPLNAWTDLRVWWSSEVDRPGSDVPGVTSNKTNFEFVHHKNASDTWQLQNFNLNAGPQPCYFSVSEVTSDSHFRAWDE
jgi:hypothetical protein